ncbi:MAG: fatty acid desaturase CarF family protein [Planctomycetota bacterium]
MFLIHAFAVLLLTDLVSGVVHWAEDTFGTERTPVVGPLIIAPNEEHHARPAAMVAKSWWQTSWELWCASAAIVVVAWALGALTWEVGLFAALCANANQVHKWTHMRRRDVPRPVRWAQRAGLLQSPRGHAAHHRGAKNTHYCTLTDWLNPLLERVNFWRRLESVTVPLFGAPRRADLARPGTRE